MTAKQKAKELYDKYEFVYIQNYTSKHEVKQCAIIAAQEIINELQQTPLVGLVEWWEAVLNELNKL